MNSMHMVALAFTRFRRLLLTAVSLLVVGYLLGGEGLAQGRGVSAAEFFGLDDKTLVKPIASFERFALFDNCRPMKLIVEALPAEATEIGLTRESIQAALESRLRSARLYDSESSSDLYINANMTGRAFSSSLEYSKIFYDRASDSKGRASAWNTGGVGSGGRAASILSWISSQMDEFLVEFLRVNEEACETR